MGIFEMNAVSINEEQEDLNPLLNEKQDKRNVFQNKVNLSNVRTVPFGNLIPKFFPCKECGYSPVSLESFVLHFETIHNQKYLPCRFCDFETKDVSTFAKHQNEEHIDIYPCGRCKFIGISYFELETHVMKCHKNAFELVFQFDYFSPSQKCPFPGCNIGFNDDINKLGRHYRAMHEGNKVFCKFCGKEYQNLGSLYAHSQGHKRKLEKLNEKRINRSFKRKSYHTNHDQFNEKRMKIDLNDDNASDDDDGEIVKYPCMTCDKDFESISSLIDHMQNLHNQI